MLSSIALLIGLVIVRTTALEEPKPYCPGDLVLTSCASACPRTCGKPEPGICSFKCESGCQCPPDKWFAGKDKCVEKDKCPHICDGALLPNPCLNGGTCVRPSEDSSFHNFTCQCTAGFVGKFCERKDICNIMNPCYNDGECVETLTDSRGKFECVCKEGFHGKYCESSEDIPLCTSKFNRIKMFAKLNPRIMDGPEFPDCLEDGSFKRKQCNTWLNFCWCVDPMTGNEIKGTQTDHHMGLTLDCDETPQQLIPGIHPCGHKNFRCNKRGTCIKVGDTYSCSCLKSYDGKYCQHSVKTKKPHPCGDVNTPCNNRGFCKYYKSKKSYKCVCSKKYWGNRCQHQRMKKMGISL